MQRFTISLDDPLASQFDALIADKGYVNRSEAVRDLIRAKLGDAHLQAIQSAWCVASLSYVYDHHDKTVTERVLSLQHDHHDLVITSLHTHLDHAHCLETVILRGRTVSVSALAQQLMALRGVRHGGLQLVPLEPQREDAPHIHDDGRNDDTGHTHFRPLS